MSDHPITPPPELIGRWEEDWHHSKVKHIELEDYIATRAAQWGADQELEACVEWISKQDWTWTRAQLRAARRPKPPSAKEQALFALAVLTSADETCTIAEIQQHWHSIRRALEQLDD
jgi:hypothetical protein